MSEEVRTVEHSIVDKLFSIGEIDGITSEGLKTFVDHRISYVLSLLGLIEEKEIKDGGEVAEWFYLSVDSFKSGDFFVTTNNEYLRKFREEDFVWE